MGQYPARDSWGGSQYARVVRNETEYWVEWVSSPGQDPYEEFITALRPAATPAAAVAVARQVLADIRNDIAQGKIYTNTALTRRKPTKDEYGMLYVRVSQPATVYDRSLYIGNYAEKSALPATKLRTIALRQYAEYERQINELPAIDEEPRWMLLADMAPDTFFGDPTKDVITPQQLDDVYARNPALAKTLLLQICLQDEDFVQHFLFTYLYEHAGKHTWVHDHIAQIPEVETRTAWERARADFEAGDGLGNSLIDDFFDDDTLRKVWLDIAAEREKKEKRE